MYSKINFENDKSAVIDNNKFHKFILLKSKYKMFQCKKKKRNLKYRKFIFFSRISSFFKIYLMFILDFKSFK